LRRISLHKGHFVAGGQPVRTMRRAYNLRRERVHPIAFREP
jgi:hypothetical protein